MDPSVGQGQGGQPETSTTATNVLWVFRIVLPILLFILWHRLQAPASGGKCSYPRDRVLAARPPPDDPVEGVPDCLQGLRLVDEGTAQRLLGLPPPRASSASAGGGRRDVRGGPRQRGGRGGNEGRRSEDWPDFDLLDEANAHAEAVHRCGDGDAQEQGKGQEPGQWPPDVAPAPSPAAVAALAEERATQLAVLQALALGQGRGQRRSFLHDEMRPPPPPPSKASAPEEATALRANSEAREVLRGLLSLRQAVLTASSSGTAATSARWKEIPRRVYRQLQEALVSPDAATFTLLVEASASLSDLPAASDFLMRMENAGHCAGNELLDMVMDLYTEGSGGKAGAGASGSWAEVEEESER